MTLVETFVAIAILMLSVAGPLTLSQRSLTAAYYSKDKMVAYYLAQDAVDHLRMLRDTNGLYGFPWLTDFGPCLNQNCVVTTNADPGLLACAGNCPVLEFNANGDFYGHNNGSWGASRFTRTVRVENVIRPAGAGGGVSPYEKSIVVTVAWRTSGFQSNSITIRENIFEWR